MSTYPRRVLLAIAIAGATLATLSSAAGRTTDTFALPTSTAEPHQVQPRGDIDRDGTPNSRDACLVTPRRLKPVVRGCAAVELAADPHLLIPPTKSAIDRARAGLAVRGLFGREAQEPLRLLRVGEVRIERGLALVAQGDVCGGARTIGEGSRMFDTARQRMVSGVLRVRRELQADIRKGEGDADGKDIAFQELGYRLMLLDRALRSVQSLRVDAGRLCGEIARRDAVEGLVVRTDDALGIVELRGGRRFALASNRRFDRVSEGSRVRFEGWIFKDGSGFGLSADPVGGISADVPDLELICLLPRVAPHQPFYPPLPNVDPSAVTLHDLKGYLVNGKLRLEDEMRIGAAGSGCLKSSGTGKAKKLLRYTLRLEFRRASAAAFTTFATDLAANEHPVPLPGEAHPSSVPATGTLRSTVQVQSCQLSGVCALPKDLTQTEYSVSVYEQGSLATATYKSTLFSLEDWDTTGFKVATLTEPVRASVISSLPVTFQALGYAASGSKIVETIKWSPSAAPSIASFAIYQDDFYDSVGLVFPEATTGADRPSGLMWPRIVGKNGGHTFWYSAALPNIVRDRVQDCGTAPDTFYRYPWASGKSYAVGQGNNTAPTAANPNPSHGATSTQSFAFDFGLDSGDTVRAARGGLVEWFQEAQTANFNPNADVTPSNQPFPDNDLQNWGNAVRLLHEDGSSAWYFHLEANRVLVEVDDVVQRGQPIALSDNTGRSSKPHLHFQVQASSVDWGQSIQIRFGECDAIPVTGDDPVSDNANPNFP